MFFIIFSITSFSQRLQQSIELGRPASVKKTARNVEYNNESGQYILTIAESKNIYRYRTDSNLNIQSGYALQFQDADSGHYKTPVIIDLKQQKQSIADAVLYSSLAVKEGDMFFYIKDVNSFLFAENGVDGRNWKITGEIKLAKKERLLSQIQDEKAVYLVSFRYDHSSCFTVYKKEWGKPVEIKQYNAGFEGYSDNGKKWPSGYNDMKRIFWPYIDYGRTFINDKVLKNGQPNSYAQMQDYIKCYFHNNRFNILINVPLDASLLFSLDLKSDKLTANVFDYGKKSFEKDAAALPVSEKLGKYSYLNMLVSNQCGMIDSMVVAARRMEDALLLIYYHAYSGELLNAELFDKNENWTGGIIRVRDSVYNESATAYEPEMFYRFLKTAAPSVNLIAVDSLAIIMSVEVRDEKDAFFKKLLNHAAALSPEAYSSRYGSLIYSYNPRDVYNERKVLSFSRQLSRKNFQPLNRKINTPPGLIDGHTAKQILEFIRTRNLIPGDIDLRPFKDGIDLVYFNRAAGSIQLLRF